MNVHKMTRMIRYSCFKHASSPSLPHQAMLVYAHLLFIRSALSLPTLILGNAIQRVYYKMSQLFAQDCSMPPAMKYLHSYSLEVPAWVLKR